MINQLKIFAGEEDTPIGAMPGCYRLGWRHGLVEEVIQLSLFCLLFSTKKIGLFSLSNAVMLKFSIVLKKYVLFLC